MPTFKTESTVPTLDGAFLLPVPFVQWFNDSVLQALAELTIPENWYTDSQEERQAAVQYASKMLAGYKLLNFNPFPVGMIFPYGGAINPPGYLLCDGAQYQTDEYPELFATIGYYYGGSGDDFNVPNLLNRMVTGAGDIYSPNDTGGEREVTLSLGQIPSHNHTDIGHYHSYNPPGVSGLALAPGELPVTLPNIIPSITGTASANITSSGGGEAHENMPPYIALTYIIYAGRENA